MIEPKFSKTRVLVFTKIAATITFVLGLVIPFLAALPFGLRLGVRSAISDTGSYAAGFWALCAGALAVYAATDVFQSDDTRRRREAANLCHAQLIAVWDFLDEIDVLALLTKAIEDSKIEQGVRSNNNLGAQQQNMSSTYRGHLGDNWLPLQSSGSDVFGALPVDLAIYVTGYFSRILNIMGRLNWLNSQQFTQDAAAWVIPLHVRTREQLTALKKRKASIEVSLKQLM